MTEEPIALLRGRIVHGKGLGRTVGMPTANLETVPGSVIPSEGVYASRVFLRSGEYIGVTNIGPRPTVDRSPARTVETNIIGFDDDIYGEDMLLSVNIPYLMGYSNPNSNAGSMKTTGFDLEVGWKDTVGELSYGVSFNLSDFQSRITKMNGSDQINGSKIHRVGSYFNEWYGYVSDGIYQTQEEVNNSATYNSAVTVGDIRYKDISGPDGVPDGKITSEDRVLLGNSLPRFQYGGTVNLAWKGIDFSLAFQGIGKQTSDLYTQMVQPVRDNYGNIPAILDGKYWSPFNTEEQNRNAKYPRLTTTGKTNNYLTSDFWLFDGSYFRLKNVTLGYTLPQKWTNKLHLNTARIYVSASDLFCISDFPKGWDPEMGVSSYPITSTILVGLNLKL